MPEKIYLTNDNNEKFLYHKIYEANIDKELDKILPSILDVDRITLHWSASSYYNTPFNHYACNIGLDYIAIADASHIGHWHSHSHSFNDNSNNLGVSILAMYDSRYPVTRPQIEMMIKVLVVLCKKYKLDPKLDIFSHADRARKFNYYPERVDVETIVNYGGKKQILTDYIRERVIADLAKHNVVPPIAPVPPKPIALPDKVVQVSSFDDVATTDWFAYSTNFVKRIGIMKGYEHPTKQGVFNFMPQKAITRKECAVVFSNLIQYMQNKTQKQLPDTQLSIVDYTDLLTNEWFYGAVRDLTDKGIMSGYNLNGNIYFKPDQEITRAEFCTLLCNLLKYLDSQGITKTDLIKPIKYIDRFIDVTNKHWAIDSITWCVVKSLLIGSKTETGSYFKPDTSIARKELAVGIYKLVKYLVNTNTIIETL